MYKILVLKLMMYDRHLCPCHFVSRSLRPPITLSLVTLSPGHFDPRSFCPWSLCPIYSIIQTKTKWQGTKWPGTEWPGTKWPGTKWPGTKCRDTYRSNATLLDVGFMYSLYFVKSLSGFLIRGRLHSRFWCAVNRPLHLKSWMQIGCICATQQIGLSDRLSKSSLGRPFVRVDCWRRHGFHCTNF
jgi:hypothetical protein